MPKRKRLRSNSTGGSDRLTKSQETTNPFDKLVPCDPTSTTKDDGNKVFSLLISFLDLNREKKDEEAKLKIREVVQALLKTLDGIDIALDNGKEWSGLVSHIDVASAILPWAIKTILHRPDQQDGNTLQWEVVSTCTSLLLSERKSERTGTSVTSSSGPLSTSTLHKLVPIAELVALDGDAAIREMAGSSYCRLVDRLYRPNLDIVCDVLLRRLGKSASNMRATQTTEKSITKVTVTTMNLLLRALKRANPKKAFQMLIAPDVLVALSDVYGLFEFSIDVEVNHPCNIINRVIREGIFSLENHMDGFRSLQLNLPDLQPTTGHSDTMDIDHEHGKEKQSPALQSYQIELITKSSTAFQAVSSDPSISDETQALARSIPLLLEGLIVQTVKLLGTSKLTGAKRKNLTRKIGHLQFLMFANLSSPIVNAIVNDDSQILHDSATCFLQPLQRCLDLLLKYDVYRPSNEDVGEKHFLFLKGLATVLVKFQASKLAKSTVSSTCLPALGALVKLNHRTLDDQLDAVLSTCCTRESQESEPSADCCNFLEVMVSTYKRLRQLDHLCKAILSAGTKLIADQEPIRLGSLVPLLQAGGVRKALFEAIQSSPMQQAKGLLSEINKWIQSTLSEGGRENRAVSEGLSIGVLLLSFFLKAIRVDASSSYDLSIEAQEIMDESVTTLLGNAADLKTIDSQGVQGLKLCSSLLNLKDRCDFWIRGEKQSPDHADIPEIIATILIRAADSLLADVGGETGFAIGELQLVACYRLRQLHARTQEKQKIALSLSSDEDHSVANQLAAKKLAKFALGALNTVQVDPLKFRDRWLLLADSIELWVAYVEDVDLNLFLTYFWACVAASGAMREDEIDKTRSKELSILQDASFFENLPVMRAFGHSSVAFASSCMLNALSGEEYRGIMDLIVLHKNATSPNWSTLISSDCHDIFKGRSGLKNKKRAMRELQHGSNYHRMANKCISVINGLQMSIWNACDDPARTVQCLVRLDFLCLELTNDTPAVDGIVTVLSSVRRMLAQLLVENDEINLEEGFLKGMFIYLFKSSTKIIQMTSLGEQSLSALLSASKLLVESIMHRYGNEVHDLAQTFLELYENSDDIGEREIPVLSAFGCSVISISHFLAENNIVLLKKIGDFFSASNLLNRIVDAAFHEDGSMKPAKDGSIHVLAVLYRYNTLVANEGLDSKLNSIEERVGKSLSRKVLDLNAEEEDSYLYLLLCFVARRPSPAVQNTLFADVVKQCSKPYPKIEVALWELASKMISKDFEKALEMVTYSSAVIATRNTSLQLRLMRLMVLNATEPSHVQALSNFARKFLSIALNSIETPSQPDDVEYASDLIIELASRREVLQIRERDISLILASVISALKLISRDIKVHFESVCHETFNACFSIVAFFLQRFSKQLFYCIPSVIGALNLLLVHSMYGEADSLDVLDRGHKYSRLCELLLPYKDIYKKHIICLVVQFVIALKDNLEPLRRESLAPAMHCLLDMLQQHETLQLNAMLDDVGRALLRTVNDGYKKQYAYKGQ